MVKHSTADREVPVSNPGVHFLLFALGCSPQFRRIGPGEKFKYQGVGLYVSL